ncbi:DUF805 domain-containing protein [Polynucleobacter kasalickyi]|uniref:Uncharacterized membrane protein YhaH, DUF805 family n=1 Tax=Polynucleobacter kasalickyi TaxID=1938817 RepID=A0A1W2B279_9BURK|nr:DUF805 domain-containing protein [Polynucleobacter kasalickyi]SMC67039.1 Uncharacterized membrane protein YhaH, DUF805 family [Polynucleobacter kasalickyi]
MQFQDAIKTCFNKYLQFEGRASRSEYWWFFLFMILAIIVAEILGQNIGTIVGLGLMLPHLTVEVRRLHDINKSGWWVLLKLIPLLNLLLLYWLIKRGDPKINQFGAPSNNPLHEVS